MTKVHIINGGPGTIVVHVQATDGKSVGPTKHLLPGEGTEAQVLTNQYLHLGEVCEYGSRRSN
jgi:hypothetical protein